MKPFSNNKNEDEGEDVVQKPKMTFPRECYLLPFFVNYFMETADLNS